MKLDRDDDGVPLHDSEEGRAMSAARRLALRDAAPDLLAALRDAKLTIEALYGDLADVTGGDFEARENTADTLRKIESAIAKAGG